MKAAIRALSGFCLTYWMSLSKPLQYTYERHNIHKYRHKCEHRDVPLIPGVYFLLKSQTFRLLHRLGI